MLKLYGTVAYIFLDVKKIHRFLSSIKTRTQKKTGSFVPPDGVYHHLGRCAAGSALARQKLSCRHGRRCGHSTASNAAVQTPAITYTHTTTALAVTSINQSIDLLKAEGPDGHLHRSNRNSQLFM